MKKHIPNTITCCNLISGCIAITYALFCDTEMAMLWIVMGAVFDFFDGLSARALGVSSPIGKELDSLADVVTFGVAPSAIVYTELCVMSYPYMLEPLREWLPYCAFIIAAFSALRLAKFNLDTRQTTSFIGLPTPANALFWSSLVVGFGTNFESQPLCLYAILALVALSSWLLVAELPMFALKFKHWGLRDDDNIIKYGFLAFSAAAIVISALGGVRSAVSSLTIIIVAYILISIFQMVTASAKKQ